MQSSLGGRCRLRTRGWWKTISRVLRWLITKWFRSAHCLQWSYSTLRETSVFYGTSKFVSSAYLNIKLEMWANAQRDGRPAEYRWRPLLNAAKFGWCPLLHRVSKNVPPLACYNFDTHEWILIFFGRNVTDKVGNQKTLYYATSSNLCFCTTWKNAETRNHIFHSIGLCYTCNAPVRYISERKKCHLWCVW